MAETAGYLSEREITDQMRDWIVQYRCLVTMGKWDDLIEHVRANVNLSKEVLLSIDPDVQRELHRGRSST